MPHPALLALAPSPQVVGAVGWNQERLPIPCDIPQGMQDLIAACFGEPQGRPSFRWVWGAPRCGVALLPPAWQSCREAHPSGRLRRIIAGGKQRRRGGCVELSAGALPFLQQHSRASPVAACEPPSLPSPAAAKSFPC